MSWAMRRRVLYVTGVAAFFLIVFGGPLAYKYFTIPPTCTDGIQNQGETGVDMGGPCPLVDERSLSPSAILWTRAFRVRDGSYNAVAYIQNPNESAGVRNVHYKFRLYDAQNVIVAEREGDTFVMPGGITPVLEGQISTGNRVAARAFFDFTDALLWEHMDDATKAVSISNKKVETDTSPRISADVENVSVGTVSDLSVVAVVFDTAGNAFAASATHVDRLGAGEKRNIVFTWPDSFALAVGRVDIIPLLAPVSLMEAQ